MTGTWLDGADVYVPDIVGTPHPISVRIIRVLAEEAKGKDSGQLKYGCDWFNRDDLIGAAELVEGSDQCAHEDRWVRCDNPAEDDLDQPRPRCAPHRAEV